MKKRIFWVPTNIGSEQCYKPIIGELIVVSGWEDIPLIISKGIFSSGLWRISHCETGLSMTSGTTQDQAILRLVEKLSTMTRKEFDANVELQKKKLPDIDRPEEGMVISYEKNKLR